MNKSTIIVTAFAAMLTMSCSNRNNPFFQESQLPYGAVEFDKIQSKDYMPAFEEGFRQLKADIDAIAASEESPTFQNTIEQLEASGQLLSKVSGVFYNLMETDADDIMKETEEKIIPLQTEADSYLYMNEKVFNKVRLLYVNRDNNQPYMNVEQKKVLEKYFRRFARNGALLVYENRNRFVAIQNELAQLRIKFAKNNLDESNAYILHVTDIKRLEGLPQDQLDGAAARAREKGLDGWAFNIQKPCWIPFLQYCKDRDLREQMYKAYYSRGNNNNEYDNKEIIKKTLSLRLEMAKLLGFKNFAEFQIEDRMAKTPQAAYDLLMEIWKYALPQAKRERDELQKIIDAEGGGFKLEAWDWWYYAEKLRKQKYDLDESELMPYFSLDNVRKGSFMVAETLFGIKFKKVDNLPVYHPSVETWECLDADGSHLAYFYTDCFVRPTKRQGAWMTNFTDEYDFGGRSQRPTIVNVCNFSVPTDDMPCLLSIDDARTVFHEFGHALHGMLTKCHYPIVSGTATPNDFVEMCSQIMEHWAVDPTILKQYAFHYKTGEPIPDELIAKLQNAGHFNTGFETVELVGAALLDMEYHMLTNYLNFDDQKFEDEISAKLGMIPEIEFRYRGTFFNHIFNNDYCAGYYSYLWAEVLDCDAFQCFVEEGLLNKETGKRYRQNILEKGGSDDLMELYRRFRGSDPKVEPMLRNRGLID
jgi:peptidyl-dipeptidase Dcp